MTGLFRRSFSLGALVRARPCGALVRALPCGPLVRAAALLGLFTLSGCSTLDRPPGPTSGDRSAVGDPAAPAAGRQTSRPRIVLASRPLECVSYARQHVDISLQGDAWTWWRAAKGRYARGRQPRVGSVLVLKQRGKSRGHLAVVTRINGPREIVVDHANWLNRGRIHLATPVRDVSAKNDWSAVRVWYTPGNVLGRSTYPAYGFIYPRGEKKAGGQISLLAR